MRLKQITALGFIYTTFTKIFSGKKQRAALNEYANSIDLLHPDNVKTPPREHGLVEGLHVMDGFECLHCEYVCHSESTIEVKHCRPKHGWVISQTSMWKEQKIQVCILTDAVIPECIA